MEIEKRSRYRDSNRNPWNNTLRVPHRTAARLSAIAASLQVNKSEVIEQIIEAAINADATWEAIADRAVEPLAEMDPCNLDTLEIREGRNWRMVDTKLSRGWGARNV